MLVGLCGYSKSGKDTIAKELGSYTRLAFADALKVEVSIMLQAVGGITVNFDNPEEKEEWRDLLVFWGRKRREQDKDYWVKQLYLRNASTFITEPVQAVITDVRYLNEVNWVRKKGGLVVYLDRDGIGPANDEERMSLTQVRQIANPIILRNDDRPDKVAQTLRKIINSFRSFNSEQKKKKPSQDNLPYHC